MSVEERAGPGIATVAGREAVRVRRPGTRDELREVVMEPDGVTLVPTGGGTQKELGNAPAGAFEVIDLHEALAGEVEHERDDLTAITWAGTRLGDLQAVLGAQGQWLPIDPPLAEDATVGGALAVGAEVRCGGATACRESTCWASMCCARMASA